MVFWFEWGIWYVREGRKERRKEGRKEGREGGRDRGTDGGKDRQRDREREIKKKKKKEIVYTLQREHKCSGWIQSDIVTVITILKGECSVRSFEIKASNTVHRLGQWRIQKSR
jgi:DNA invertase Pin-like site-specific DNA recombinase